MSEDIGRIEFRNDEKGRFDELIAEGASVHFEMMDKNHLWVGIEAGGKSYGIWIWAKGKLTISTEDQSDPSPHTKEGIGE